MANHPSNDLVEQIRARADEKSPDPWIAVGDRDALLDEYDSLKREIERLTGIIDVANKAAVGVGNIAADLKLSPEEFADLAQRYQLAYSNKKAECDSLKRELRIANDDREIFAKWIAMHPPRLRDHACAMCIPEGGELVKVGFSCGYHHAVGFLALRTAEETSDG